jgi:hypothetical protein
MKDNYIKIYSHPRSGTHFLEAFLAKNFYNDENLSSEGPIYFGHWSNKILLEEGEPYHKLFGSHFFPDKAEKFSKMIYVYRDGRASIASMWNSKFYNIDWEGITFSEFLRKEIDWLGGPGQKSEPQMNIIQHWYKHTSEWLELKKSNLLFIRFEDLKNNPEKVYFQICKKFYPLKYIKHKIFKISINPINYKVGLSPNKATINSWKDLFSKEDLDFFYKQIPSKQFLFEE